MSLPFPIQIDTAWKKTQYILRMEEYLRFLHNFAGHWYKNGLTTDQYNNGMDSGLLGGEPGSNFVLTAQLKTKYPYQATITKAQFRAFVEDEWEPRNSVVHTAIDMYIKTLKNNNAYDHLLDLNF